MNARVQVPMRQTAVSRHSIRAAPFGVLLRKCSCGGSGSSGGECEACRKDKLQRSAFDRGQESAPPIVHEVLRAPGQPLDESTRAFFEPRFRHDFSNVRVHSDARARESARAVNALAYTVRDDIVFANTPSFSRTAADTRILAHELTHVLQQSGGSEAHAGLRVGSIDSIAEREASQAANTVLSNETSTQPVHAVTSAIQRQTGQTPTQKTPTQTTQTPAQTQADPVWGSKKWPGFEDDWNAFYQLAVQGLSGSNLKPDKIGSLAAMIADISMGRCLKHGKELQCAKAAAPDEDTKAILDITLPWGPNATWGQTFRSALQSTSASVDGPISANKAVERACDIADQAARGMLSTAAQQIYVNCKTGAQSSSPQSRPTAPTGGHSSN